MWPGCGRFACRPVAVLHADYHSGLSKEQCQLVPVLEHVADRLTQATVRLDPVLLNLFC